MPHIHVFYGEDEAVFDLTDDILAGDFPKKQAAGEKRIFDMSVFLSMPAYKTLDRVFTDARVEFGTVVWPGDIDISPETLYLKSIRDMKGWAAVDNGCESRHKHRETRTPMG